MNTTNNDFNEILSKVNKMNLSFEEKNRLIEIIKITNIPKRKPFLNFFIVFSTSLIFVVLSFVIAISCAPTRTNTDITGITFPVIFFSGMAIIIFLHGIKQIKNDRYLYENYNNNANEYKLQIAIRKLNKEKQVKKEEIERQQKIQNEKQVKYKQNSINIPKCPTCGSTNIRKISTTRKVAGVIGFVLLGKTAKSQFECKNCGYKW